jgi:hypothetical protein
MEASEVDEKFNEKELEKQEEKSPAEKSQSDPVGTIAWAAFLIWAGVLLLLHNLDRMDVLLQPLRGLNLPQPNLPFDLPFVDVRAWQLFFLGAGVIVLIEVLVRLLLPEYRKSVIGSIIWAAILFGLALGNWILVGPLAVIGIGVAILLSGLIRKG